MAQQFLAMITILSGDSVAHPSHPISLPGDPGFGQIPGFTPGTPPPRPTPAPTPPIAGWPGGLPGGGGFPGQGGPVDPGYGIDSGHRPTHPIVLPPDLPPTLPDPDNRPLEWKTAWTPQTGWVVVGVPTGPAPTPSA